MRFQSISAAIVLAWMPSTFLISGASAEILDLACRAADSSQSRHLMVDLTAGLVSNEAGGSGRPWAARITGNEIIWDEVFDSRIGHTANHYVFDRGTGTLHRIDMTRNESGRETMNVVCQKAS